MQRWAELGAVDDRRQGPRTKPANALSRGERDRLRSTLLSTEFCDLPPAQIVTKLVDREEYQASESTMYRLLKELEMDARRGPVAAPSKRSKPDERTATGPNQIWSWDITNLRTRVNGEHFKLYMVMDVWSRKVVAHAVHVRESGELAADLLGVALKREGVARNQLTLHSDNGGPMKHWTLAAKLDAMAVAKTHSRPRVSNDNPFSESLFRTLKTRSHYPKEGFETLETAQAWAAEFVAWYDEDHFHRAITYTSPGSRHRGEDVEILKRRQSVYEAAIERHPERWSGPPRGWSRVEEVSLHKEIAVL